jgi:hypothetical protein
MGGGLVDLVGAVSCTGVGSVGSVPEDSSSMAVDLMGAKKFLITT